jgi:hypothetical protein
MASLSRRDPATRSAPAVGMDPWRWTCSRSGSSPRPSGVEPGPDDARPYAE